MTYTYYLKEKNSHKPTQLHYTNIYKVFIHSLADKHMHEICFCFVLNITKEVAINF